ncbi:MAG: flagellar protein FlgN [Planctomycetota bacterium]
MPSDAVQCADLADDMERFLADLDRVYTELESVLDAKRDAFRTADAGRLAGVLSRERSIFTSIDQIEQRRRNLISTTSRTSGRTYDPMQTSVSELAQSLPPEDAARIQDMSRRVKDRIEKVRNESAVLREVANQLHVHVQNLARRFHYAAGGSGVYGRKGGFQSPNGRTNSVDLRR